MCSKVAWDANVLGHGTVGVDNIHHIFQVKTPGEIHVGGKYIGCFFSNPSIKRWVGLAWDISMKGCVIIAK